MKSSLGKGKLLVLYRKLFHTNFNLVYSVIKIKMPIFLFRDHKILELLYEEAKYNILTGRYPCEISDYIMLGGIQARLELGPYDITVHTPSYFRTIMYR